MAKTKDIYEIPTNREAIVFDSYVENNGTDRIFNRLLMHDRCVKPCGKECWEYGKLIASTTNHKSFQNFNVLMDDMDFVIEIAKITPNPLYVENFYLDYVHPKIRYNKKFKYEFLKSLYQNPDIYKVKDIVMIAEIYEMEKQYRKIIKSAEVKAIVESRLYGLDRENLSKHEANLVRDGLKELIQTFECKDELEV